MRLNLREWLRREFDQINTKLGEIMSALTDLQTATANLSTEIVTFLNDVAGQISGGVSASDAEAVVSQINGFTAQLQAADPANQPAPAPAAPPASS
jgi:hypothetical protein